MILLFVSVGTSIRSRRTTYLHLEFVTLLLRFLDLFLEALSISVSVLGTIPHSHRKLTSLCR
jgi:hypothetical protein